MPLFFLQPSQEGLGRFSSGVSCVWPAAAVCGQHTHMYLRQRLSAQHSKTLLGCSINGHGTVLPLSRFYATRLKMDSSRFTGVQGSWEGGREGDREEEENERGNTRSAASLAKKKVVVGVSVAHLVGEMAVEDDLGGAAPQHWQARRHLETRQSMARHGFSSTRGRHTGGLWLRLKHLPLLPPLCDGLLAKTRPYCRHGKGPKVYYCRCAVC